MSRSTLYPAQVASSSCFSPMYARMDATSRWYHDVTGGRRCAVHADAAAATSDAGRGASGVPSLAPFAVASTETIAWWIWFRCLPIHGPCCVWCVLRVASCVSSFSSSRLPRVVRAARSISAPRRASSAQTVRNENERVASPPSAVKPQSVAASACGVNARAFFEAVAFSSSSADAEGSIAISSMFTPPENQRSSPSTNPAPPPPRCANAHASVETS